MLNYIALVKVLLFLWRVITLPMKSSLEHNAMILRDAHAGGWGKPFACLLVCYSPRSEASCIQCPSETFWVSAQTGKPASPSSSTQECLAPALSIYPGTKQLEYHQTGPLEEQLSSTDDQGPSDSNNFLACLFSPWVTLTDTLPQHSALSVPVTSYNEKLRS